MKGLTVEAVTSAFSRLAIVMFDDSIPANGGSSRANRGVGAIITCLRYFQAAWEISCHDITACFIENRLIDSWIGCAESFPVPKCCVKWGNVTISDSERLQMNLWLLWVQDVLAHDLCSECREVVSLWMSADVVDFVDLTYGITLPRDDKRSIFVLGKCLAHKQLQK